MNQDRRNSRRSSPASIRRSRSQIPVTDPLPTYDLEKAESCARHESGDPDVASAMASKGPDDLHQEERRPDQSNTLSTTRTEHQTFGIEIGHAIIGILVRSRTTREGGGDEKVFVVGYEGEKDMMNPHNWSNLTRWAATNSVTIASIGWIVGFASSIDSAALPQAAAEFGVSEVTESLATSVFLIGFGCGALVAGPISETVGRNPVYITTLSLYMVFIMASGLAPNIGAQLVFRFLAGLFGSTPLTCAGGSISDLWAPLERVYAFPVFANAAFMGPIFGRSLDSRFLIMIKMHFIVFALLANYIMNHMFANPNVMELCTLEVLSISRLHVSAAPWITEVTGPIVGGFIGQSSLVSWRWVEWITLIISGLVLILVILFQPETYAPILLKWKAAHLRALTGDPRYRAEVEIRQETLFHRIRQALYRPFLLTFHEPIVMLVALYLTVIYIILFTFLNGYTFIFTETYGLSQGLTGLAFIGIGIGLCGASLLVPLIYIWARQDLAIIKEHGGTRLPPEFRLWFSMLGAPAIPISMFVSTLDWHLAAKEAD
ncbi:hypothetical protein MMC13_007905 [Lambiella insularis]|nr:hypothetical protein [Lambiella insularis]